LKNPTHTQNSFLWTSDTSCCSASFVLFCVFVFEQAILSWCPDLSILFTTFFHWTSFRLILLPVLALCLGPIIAKKVCRALCTSLVLYRIIQTSNQNTNKIEQIVLTDLGETSTHTTWAHLPEAVMSAPISDSWNDEWRIAPIWNCKTDNGQQTRKGWHTKSRYSVHDGKRKNT